MEQISKFENLEYLRLEKFKLKNCAVEWGVSAEPHSQFLSEHRVIQL